jgi:hypothetical protein
MSITSAGTPREVYRESPAYSRSRKVTNRREFPPGYTTIVCRSHSPSHEATVRKQERDPVESGLPAKSVHDRVSSSSRSPRVRDLLKIPANRRCPAVSLPAHRSRTSAPLPVSVCNGTYACPYKRTGDKNIPAISHILRNKNTSD